MSSILKALKKLENEMPLPNEPEGINTKKVLHKRIHEIWVINNILIGFITAGVIIGIGWLVLNWNPVLIQKLFPKTLFSEQHIESTQTSATPIPKTEEKAPASQMKIDMKPQESEIKKAASRLSKITESDSGQLKITAIRKPEKKVQIVIPETLPEHPITIVPEVTIVKPSQNETTDETTDENENLEKEEHKNDQIEKKEPAPLPTEEPEFSAQRIADGKLKVQALVWAKDPKNRIAVVNDRVVRTGGFIDDVFLVKYIGNNYVIVQDGEKEWKVEFQGK